MASGWAMAMNFDRSCTYDEPEITCREAKGDPSIKGAMLFAEYTSGAGYVPKENTPKEAGRGPGRDRALFVGGMEQANYSVFFPSTGNLARHTGSASRFLACGQWLLCHQTERLRAA